MDCDNCATFRRARRSTPLNRASSLNFSMHPRIWKSVGRPALIMAVIFSGMAPLLGAEGAGAPPFIPVTWLPSAEETLTHRNIPHDQIVLSTAGATHRKGDTVTVLAQIKDEQGKVRQWAVVFLTDDLSEADKKYRSFEYVLYGNDGREFKFEAKPLEKIAIHVFGPFEESGRNRSHDVWSGALVNPDFLGLGLDQTARFWLKIRSALNSDPFFKDRSFTLGFNSAKESNPPLNPAERATFDHLAIPLDQERAFAGSMPALLSFFGIASQTPEVRDIIFDAVDVPWWSMVAHGGKITDTNFEFIEPFEEISAAEWGLPSETKVYAIGLVLRLQGKPALHLRLALTAPRPPLFNCAGILGISAVRPDGKGPRLMFRVMGGEPAR